MPVTSDLYFYVHAVKNNPTGCKYSAGNDRENIKHVQHSHKSACTIKLKMKTNDTAPNLNLIYTF